MRREKMGCGRDSPAAFFVFRPVSLFPVRYRREIETSQDITTESDKFVKHVPPAEHLFFIMRKRMGEGT